MNNDNDNNNNSLLNRLLQYKLNYRSFRNSYLQLYNYLQYNTTYLTY